MFIYMGAYYTGESPAFTYMGTYFNKEPTMFTYTGWYFTKESAMFTIIIRELLLPWDPECFLYRNIFYRVIPNIHMSGNIFYRGIPNVHAWTCFLMTIRNWNSEKPEHLKYGQEKRKIKIQYNVSILSETIYELGILCTPIIYTLISIKISNMGPFWLIKRE